MKKALMLAYHAAVLGLLAFNTWQILQLKVITFQGISLVLQIMMGGRQ